MKLGPENNWFKTSRRKKWLKRSLILQYSFAQNTLHILRTSTHSTLLTIYFRKPGRHPPTLQISQQTCVWLVSEKYLHYTISRRPRIAFSKKANVYIFLHISVKQFYSRDVKSFYLVVSWIISLRQLVVWAS